MHRFSTRIAPSLTKSVIATAAPVQSTATANKAAPTGIHQAIGAKPQWPQRLKSNQPTPSRVKSPNILSSKHTPGVSDALKLKPHGAYPSSKTYGNARQPQFNAAHCSGTKNSVNDATKKPWTSRRIEGTTTSQISQNYVTENGNQRNSFKPSLNPGHPRNLNQQGNVFRPNAANLQRPQGIQNSRFPDNRQGNQLNKTQISVQAPNNNHPQAHKDINQQAKSVKPKIFSKPSITASIPHSTRSYGLSPARDAFPSHESNRQGSVNPRLAGKDRDKLKRERENKKKETNHLSKSKESKTVKPRDIHLHEGTSIANLASLMGIKYERLAKRVKAMGFESNDADYVMNSENASLIVMEYGMNPHIVEYDQTDISIRPEPTNWDIYPTRPPVVTIMGHVDHGKTTLLDALRKTSVAAGEAGGITQHIGAFSVLLASGKRITFLDTPGHAAFSAMRSRGAKSTDIIVLVVAADDGIMPQTIEAIHHAQACGVPIIVAISKCDKPDIDIKRIKHDLMRYEIILEEFGGEVPSVQVSGLTGKGLDLLEETILTLAEVNSYRGDESGHSEGIVIESHLDRGRGNVATVLVKRGTLLPGSILLAGTNWCKVRQLVNDQDVVVDEAKPSYPVQVFGWKSLPDAGDIVQQTDSESYAKKIITNRIRKAEMASTLSTIQELNDKRQKIEDSKVDETFPTLHLIIKTDVHGSLDAILSVMEGLPSNQIKVEVVQGAVGKVGEADIDMAVATGGIRLMIQAPS